MTPGGLGGGNRTESGPVLLEGFIQSVFSLPLYLSISVKGSSWGLSEYHPLLIKRNLINAFSLINRHRQNKSFVHKQLRNKAHGKLVYASGSPRPEAPISQSR